MDVNGLQQQKKKETKFAGFQIDSDVFDAVLAIAEEQNVKPAVVWRNIVENDEHVKAKVEAMHAIEASEESVTV